MGHKYREENSEENTLNPSIYVWLMGQKKEEAKPDIICIRKLHNKHNALEMGQKISGEAKTPKFHCIQFDIWNQHNYIV